MVMIQLWMWSGFCASKHGMTSQKWAMWHQPLCTGEMSIQKSTAEMTTGLWHSGWVAWCLAENVKFCNRHILPRGIKYLECEYHFYVYKCVKFYLAEFIYIYIWYRFLLKRWNAYRVFQLVYTCSLTEHSTGHLCDFKSTSVFYCFAAPLWAIPGDLLWRLSSDRNGGHVSWTWNVWNSPWEHWTEDNLEQLKVE